MGDVSTGLRRARERAGLRIEDISARTKIKPAFVRALESGHFEALPGHFFTRAFLRSYAREVGLSPDETVREFDLVHTAPPVELEAIASAVDERERRREPSRRYRPVLPGGAWPVVAAAAVAMLIFIFVDTPEPARRLGPQPVGTSGVAAAPVPTSAQGGAPAPDVVTVDIRPTDTIWVAATADGVSAVYKLLQPGQHVTVKGREIAFRIGNAAAFAFSINGAPGKPVGAPDEVREFQINTANYRHFLR